MDVRVNLTEPDTYEKETCEKGAHMMAKKKVRYPCKCSKVDPQHTIEAQEDGWTRYVCSSCGKVKFAWREGAVKGSEEK